MVTEEDCCGARFRRPAARRRIAAALAGLAGAVLAIAAPVLMLAAPAHAAGPSLEGPFLPRNLYGEAGLIDMPSARMAPDGEISVSISALENTQRYGFSFQALPWLSTAFRYSHLSGLFNQNYYDRSFGLRLRLFQETVDWPEISVGVRDLVGTGIYGAEYLVASKRIGRDFDATLGIGWGRLGSIGAFDNPIGLVLSSFKTRKHVINTGEFNTGELFHGRKVGLFGGLIWHTPVHNLDFLVEYSSDRYEEENFYGLMKRRMPVNVGLSWRPIEHITLGAGWLYGTTYGISLTVDADPTKALSGAKLGAQPPPVRERTLEQQQHAIVRLQNRNLLETLPGPAKSSAWSAASLANLLTDNGDEIADYEIDGRTLVINVSAGKATAQRCARYARLSAQTHLGLRSVALTNLNSDDGAVAVCDLPPALPQSAVFYSGGRITGLFDTAAETREAASGPVSAAAVEARIRTAAAEQVIHIDAVGLERSEIWVYFTNTHYYLETEAVGRLARILMAAAPPDVEIFHLVSVIHGVPVRQTQILRSTLERVLLANGGTAEMGDALTIKPAPASNPMLDANIGDNYPRLSWSISPATRQSAFDPELPLQVQMLVAVNSTIDLYPGLTLSATLDANIFNNFTFRRESNSELPHVRSDVQKYYKKGLDGIANLTASYRTRLSPDVFAQISAGYLEDMFGGGGVQVVWRPKNSRVVIGADLYQVWQRDFNRLFGFQNYNVLTGHVTLYYESPWYGLNFNVHAGRYLAGDYGATLEVTRRFESGVEIGAFATFTNVPFSKFGEGSFDKGIVVRIPLEWALPFHSQSSYSLLMRPIQRDGGQRLVGDDSLYDETRSTSYGAFARHLDDIANP
ncbi:MAG: YjbH domain-containing protein [Alphaproteobacteria bacterium]|nr:YjbH domain-containing protein [Alphaproteobacteria bacterium]